MSPENAMQDHYNRMNDAREAELKEARIVALNDCYDKVRFNGPDILLAAGEMTAQELLAVRAVMDLKCRAIQSLIAEASK